MSAQQKLEWRFSEEENDSTPHWQVLPEEARNREAHRSQPSQLYNLLLGFAILYGFAVYLIWQQVEHRIAVLEDELTTLRSELFSRQDVVSEKIDTQGTISGVDTHLRHDDQFATDYLRFETSVRTADVVQSISQQVDTAYQQFYQDFGVALPTVTEQLLIIVDPAVNLSYSITDENVLMVPLPIAAAERNDLTLADALTHELLSKLSESVLNKALQARPIKAQWRAMTLAIKTHLQLEYGYNKNWSLEPTLLHNRHRAQNHSLAVAQSLFTIENDPTDPGLLIISPAHETADPLIEFLLENYGYPKIPELLDAFVEHESWETLSPAVFGISAAELEENWHAYLRDVYPKMRE